MSLWEIDIYPADEQPDLEAIRLAADARDMGLVDNLSIRTARGYLIEADLEQSTATKLACELLADGVVESTVAAPIGDAQFAVPDSSATCLVHVMPKPGVMDPVAQSALSAMNDMGVSASSVRTFKKYWIADVDNERMEPLKKKLLANDSIEQVLIGPLNLDQLDFGSSYCFQRRNVPIRERSDQSLMELSRQGQLYLTLVEMQTIQEHFRTLGREPTDIELETIAQTWSEHCSHKTLAGRISYQDEKGERNFENLLKETIFAATETIRRDLGEDDWCVSVFRDNAGIVRFDDQDNVVFKVETHNHPSALEPYGGANTGIGGVIRDPLGTGLGAKPVCNTDVFCFAPPDVEIDNLPAGVLHPRRVMKGVVSGVRDYGNRMGIPTVNGALYFDQRYLGNPLVYCGNVGIIPRDKCDKRVEPGDFIVAIGGRTGRDGIHGATFSSAELTSESETLSGGAVQIGNAITEKMVTDVLLQARDQGLYHAVTDCGAGGFSSAVGEMGEEVGAEVWLEKVPLKYEGLSYTEIWISEAQERMVLAVPPDSWEAFRQLCASEDVEATILGRFVETGRLELKYDGANVGDLSMEFLHDGRPPVVRQANYAPRSEKRFEFAPSESRDFTDHLRRILGSWNVSSKEWVIRQYDHEVQGGSVVKPLVGAKNDGPSDAAVIRPNIRSRRGLVISCGMNPRFGDFDTYHMAASAIDEALRNNVAVGADPDRIALLDNFCWGYTDRPETLGSLVRAAVACHDMAVALRTPFISGKDSLNNEFSFEGESGQKQTISIPPSLLISALGQMDDVRSCTTMDFKRVGSAIYQVGLTRNEMGGSHFAKIEGHDGGSVPQVDPELARRTFKRLHSAIKAGLVLACHDLSEGGLAVAIAEMAFAGEIGARIELQRVPSAVSDSANEEPILLFSESNTRFLCEVAKENVESFESIMSDIPHNDIGKTIGETILQVRSQLEGEASPVTVLQDDLATLKEAWQAPLRRV